MTTQPPQSTAEHDLPEHIFKPHMRPVQPVRMEKDGKPFVALRDPMMLSRQTMVIQPQAMNILQQFQGMRTLDEIADQFSTPVDQFSRLATELDKVGLLWGPTFDSLEDEMRQKIASAGAFPASASTSAGIDPNKFREGIEQYFEQCEDPELDAMPRGIVAPHLDYQRGWPNYAASYYPFQNVDGDDAPDRVVILGTNHFGLGDGVVLAEYGFTTPLGVCPADTKIISGLVERFGRPLIVDQLDHHPEHSIELHVPWIQYCFGNVPIVAALIPDPLSDTIDEPENERVPTDQFIAVLREQLDQAGGETLFIASSDLSHVGAQFGEPRPVDEQRRYDVERHDRDMLSKYLSGDVEEFLGAMQWNRNPTRWCSIGNMSALLTAVEPEELELIDYRQACDDKGAALVSSAAIAMW